jgi:anti-anti-sigma factor
MKQPSDFSLNFSRDSGKVVVQVQGALDAGAAPTLRERLVDIIDGQGNRQVVLDLREVTAVDFAGLVVLVETLRRMDGYGGELVLSGPTVVVAGQLRAAGLGELFLITPDWRHPAWGRIGARRGWEHESAPFN